MPAVVITRATGESLTVDGTIREQHDRGARVTDHPIETGSTVSDHIQALPLTLTISAVWTETPLDTRIGALPVGPARIREVVRFLGAILGETVDVTTSKAGTYASMALVRLPVVYSLRGDLPTELTFRELVIAESQRVQIPAWNTSSPSAVDEQDVGQQATETAPDDLDTRSTAAVLFDAMIGGR